MYLMLLHANADAKQVVEAPQREVQRHSSCIIVVGTRSKPHA